MDHKRAEEVAANRLQIILPLMDPALDKAKKQDLKEAASIQYGVSERTIRRWINSYTVNGFDGLKPKAPETSGTSKIPENLIVIMNESFSDLRTYPNFKTDTELMPGIDALKENTQKGSLLVSVKGGTTANTEYEFLTGNSCVLSPSTVVYNSFIKLNQFSLHKPLVNPVPALQLAQGVAESVAIVSADSNPQSFDDSPEESTCESGRCRRFPWRIGHPYRNKLLVEFSPILIQGIC